MNNRSWLL